MTSTHSEPQPSNQATGNPATALPGWVNTFYRTYKGKRLGPYYVRRWKATNKVYREYIKPADVEKVRAACQLYRDMQDDMMRSVRSNNTFIDNCGFLLRMIIRSGHRKPIPIPFTQFLARLKQEGMRITGRPSLRRKVTRQLIVVDGQKLIRKTVHELDGTTQVSHSSVLQSKFCHPERGLCPTRDFMVPIFDKRRFEPPKLRQTTFEQQFIDLYHAIFGHQPPPITAF